MLNYDDILNVKQIYERGDNITSFLKSEYRLNSNTSEVIEIAYDLQAGSYIKNMSSNSHYFDRTIDEMLTHLNPYFKVCDSILDVGAGELTTLTSLITKAKYVPNKIFALDISWSRLYKGMVYFRDNCPVKSQKALQTFVADMKAIPLPSKSIDVIISSHALEPNGNTKDLEDILAELFRVARKKLVLFEPSYELNSLAGKKRMEKLGYIRNLECSVRKLGGQIESVNLLKSIVNPLNPTACYVITPPFFCDDSAEKITLTEVNCYYSAPASEFMLKRIDNFLYSPELGLAYPVLKNIPILKDDSKIIATALLNPD